MIALIPARGGSKGVPEKNIRIFDGVPLIAHTIKAALEASCIDRVIVTTDDQEIAQISKGYGAEVPFLRPKELAADTSLAVDVYIHAIEYIMRESSETIEKFMVLLPTSPLRTGKHIDEAFDLFYEKNAFTLISVKEAETPPGWYMTQLENGRIINCNFGCEGGKIKNRQEEGDYYIPNGAIYILDYKLLKEKGTYYCANTIPYIMGRNESVDIDTVEDFEYASYLIKQIKHM